MKKIILAACASGLLCTAPFALAGQHPNATERAALDAALTKAGFVAGARSSWKKATGTLTMPASSRAPCRNLTSGSTRTAWKSSGKNWTIDLATARHACQVGRAALSQEEPTEAAC